MSDTTDRRVDNVNRKIWDMEALAVACPFCETAPHQSCVTGYGEPRETHFTRQLLADGELQMPVTTQRQLWAWMDDRGVR